MVFYSFFAFLALWPYTCLDGFRKHLRALFFSQPIPGRTYRVLPGAVSAVFTGVCVANHDCGGRYSENSRSCRLRCLETIKMGQGSESPPISSMACPIFGAGVENRESGKQTPGMPGDGAAGTRP